MFEDGEVTWARTRGRRASPTRSTRRVDHEDLRRGGGVSSWASTSTSRTRCGTPRQLLSHTSGLQHQLPGEEWGTLVFPGARGGRRELRGGRARASAWALSLLEPRLPRARRARRGADGQADRGGDPGPAARPARPAPHDVGARGALCARLLPRATRADARQGRDQRLGRLWSTAGDVARWGAYLLGLEELHRPYAHAGWDEAFGLGVECVRVDGARALGHEGATAASVDPALRPRRERGRCGADERDAFVGVARSRRHSFRRASVARRRAGAGRGRGDPRLVVVGGHRAPLSLARAGWRPSDAVFVAGSARPLPPGPGPRGGRAAPRRAGRGRRAGPALVGRYPFRRAPGYSY